MKAWKTIPRIAGCENRSRPRSILGRTREETGGNPFHGVIAAKASPRRLAQANRQDPRLCERDQLHSNVAHGQSRFRLSQTQDHASRLAGIGDHHCVSPDQEWTEISPCARSRSTFIRGSLASPWLHIALSLMASWTGAAEPGATSFPES